MEKAMFVKAADVRPPPRSIGWLILAVLNLLNGLTAAVWALVLLLSSSDPTYAESNNVLGSCQTITAVGMLGVGICLIVHRKSALVGALITVALSLIQAGIVVPLAADKTFGVAGAMVALFGWISTGMFAVVPSVTLIVLIVAFPRGPKRPGEEA